MDRNEAVLKMVGSWVSKVGRRDAMKRLIARGLALTTVDKLISLRYTSTPRDMLAEVLLEEMAKDGITVDPQAG